MSNILLKKSGDYGIDIDVINVDIDFVNESEKDITIPINKKIREILRGRLYIQEDQGAFNQFATYTFYNKSAKTGKDAFWRTAAKLVYTELEVATTGGNKNVIPDDHVNFSPNDLIYFIDGVNSEFIRLATIANTMIAEDNPLVHAINVGIVRVSEFSGFSIFNNESGTDVYLKIKFSANQTVNLRMELVVKKIV